MVPSPRIIGVGITLARLVPARLLRGLAWIAGNLAFALDSRRRRAVIRSLERLVPDATAARRFMLARRTFASMASAAIDLFRLPSLGASGVLGLVEVEGLGHLDAAVARGKGVIVATAHLGPYELGGAFLAAMGYPVHGMAEDLDPETNAALGRYRAATGMKVISRNAGVRSLYRLLKEGQVILLVADRVVGAGSEGLVVGFAGGSRAIPTGPAAFALATGAPVVVGYIVRNAGKGPRYRVRLEPPVLPGTRDPAAAEALTRLIGDRLGRAVASHPDEWYVFQPQWTSSDGTA